MKKEKLKRMRKLDVLAVLILAIVWSGITYFISSYEILNFGVLILVTSLFISFAALLIKKLGSVLLFMLFSGMITSSVNNLSYGWEKVSILVISGIIFEAVFLFVDKEYFNIPLNVIMGTGTACLSIPVSMMFFVPASALKIEAWNLALTSFIVGVIGAVISFMLWYKLKSTKVVIKFEYRV